MVYLRIMAVILIMFWITAVCLTGIHSCEGRDEGNCTTFTVVKCGDPRGRFRLTYCSPKDKDFEKINSVHLDTRYPNRYCIRDNQEKFGMTADAKKMWVSDFCHGTFCVCLQPAINKNQTNQEDRNRATTVGEHQDNNTDDNRVTANKRNETDGVEDSTKIVSSNMTDSPSKDMLNVTDEKMQSVVTEGAVNKTQTSVDSTHRDSSSSGKISTGNGDDHAIVTDPMLKYMLIIFISLGGLVLSLLVITIACLCYKRKRKGPVAQPVVFREQSLSSSALVPAELLNDASLYEIIPADRTASQKKTPQPRNINPDMSPTINNVPAKHEYFTLAPEVCKFCTPGKRKDETNIYNRPQEGREYDMLMSVPRSPVSDGTTYHHLWSFSREEKETIDCSTQTETMDSG